MSSTSSSARQSTDIPECPHRSSFRRTNKNEAKLKWTCTVCHKLKDTALWKCKDCGTSVCHRCVDVLLEKRKEAEAAANAAAVAK
jgi:hypothetical protein